ncbi:MAG: hypothetical protein G01um101448_414 [Parcubacteria group bacterium Gr01-1014_48]|nr:MAG: hypothetical protein Greene041614_794 [Parcubacteria group bacterium Greene0416_14]TSC73983.1 MAG: hypothetical protein G01um101448_414 [Parcubacteria group bacterium Gr01-1014_48]TSD00454.1 MAG: hypothetical protein Greene101415_844 [Parcubacteria group bacterium Greene1014_15]TSD07872.1 MAG: hypothetical protein Greene07144_640 [Parcubacteria group bacterium Greene0714_4]
MHRHVRVLALFTLVIGFVSFAQAQNETLPDYTNWPHSFSAAMKIKFQGADVEAIVTMYFNNTVPKEASQIISDLLLKLEDGVQHFVQYVVIQKKDTGTGFVNFNAELYRANADKMLLLGARNFTLPMNEFYDSIMLPEKKESPASDSSENYDYDYQ